MLKELSRCNKNRFNWHQNLLLIVMTFITGCENSLNDQINLDSFEAAAIPAFPVPAPETEEEIKKACSAAQCPNIYDWLGKLMIFEQQIDVYKQNSLTYKGKNIN
jgi:hypothetical protein